MFKKLNEKDRKKIQKLLFLGGICIAVLIGLSILPGDNKEEKNVSKSKAVNKQSKEKSTVSDEGSLEEKLKKILAKIEGAGELDVMVTFESSEEIQPAFNTNSTTEKTEEKDPQGGERSITTSSENKTIITSNSSNPVIIKTNEAKVKGVIVVSSGANDPKVKETLYSAVKTSLQISGHQVEIYSK